MKIVQKEFRVSTRSRTEMVDITGQVAAAVRETDVRDGDVIVFCPHTTAAITINENADPSVVHDILLALDEILPRANPGFRHEEGNSDAHCKSSLLGCSEQVLIKDGSLVLGTWQALYFCEFDGPRSRRVIVQVRGPQFTESL
jgi:secondary thiamine-phosphate synthase enzyme